MFPQVALKHGLTSPRFAPASGWLCRRGLAPILVLCAKSPRLMVPCAFLLRKPMKRSEPLRMVLAQRHYGMMG